MNSLSETQIVRLFSVCATEARQEGLDGKLETILSPKGRQRASQEDAYVKRSEAGSRLKYQMRLYRCLVALYFIGADKDRLQAEMTDKGAVPPVVRLCWSSQAEIQAEAADVAKVLARNAQAASIIVDCGTALLSVLTHP